jgi:hypothetical protein
MAFRHLNHRFIDFNSLFLRHSEGKLRVLRAIRLLKNHFREFVQNAFSNANNLRNAFEWPLDTTDCMDFLTPWNKASSTSHSRILRRSEGRYCFLRASRLLKALQGNSSNSPFPMFWMQKMCTNGFPTPWNIASLTSTVFYDSYWKHTFRDFVQIAFLNTKNIENAFKWVFSSFRLLKT